MSENNVYRFFLQMFCSDGWVVYVTILHISTNHHAEWGDILNVRSKQNDNYY
jgi:hypothetical protein